MFFVAQQISAELSLTTPPVCCCNCGGGGELSYVETPMKQVRYFFVFGTELTLTEFFPYCADCKRTAARVRQGWLGKTLIACMLTAVMFLVLVIAAESLPKLMSENLFRSAMVTGVLLASAWFYCLDWSRKGRTYYQPVSLVQVRGDRHGSNCYHLKFYNKVYAGLMAGANKDLIAHGVLRVEARG